MFLKISFNVRRKLKEKHEITVDEIRECFQNRRKGFLADVREKNRTHPPTLWFISQTDTERRIKVVFIRQFDGTIEIKTAFTPDFNEEMMYERKNKKAE